MTVEILQCPECGVHEIHPEEKGKCCIRGYKVFDNLYDHHQCLRCSGAWNSDLTEYNQDNHDSSKGWFETPHKNTIWIPRYAKGETWDD